MAIFKVKLILKICIPFLHKYIKVTEVVVNQRKFAEKSSSLGKSVKRLIFFQLNRYIKQ